MELGGQRHVPAAVPPEITRVPIVEETVGALYGPLIFGMLSDWVHRTLVTVPKGSTN